MANNDSKHAGDRGINITDMRNWDTTLLERYSPTYHLVNQSCTLCALGPCDLNKERLGACGQDQRTFMAREALMLAVTGAAAHASHARDVVERLISERGQDLALDLGEWVHINMPIAQIVTGAHPEKLGDLLMILDYIDTQIVRLLASAHFGGESSYLDLESKTFHAGTMDILSMEVAEVAQVSGYSFPKGDPETKLIPIGMEKSSSGKLLILCIGHHSDAGYRIMEKIDSAGLDDAIEVAGLCCTAHDIVRGYATKENAGSHGPKVIGNLRDQLRFVRSGKADIVVVDQQCVRLDLLPETLRKGAFFIATSDQSCAGLRDETDRDPVELASELLERGDKAVFVSDPEKAASLTINLAKACNSISVKKIVSQETEAIWRAAKDCNDCGLCTRHCPISLSVSEAIFSLGEEIRNMPGAKHISDLFSVKIKELYERCIACGRCDAACPKHIPVMGILGLQAGDSSDAGWMRIGRGPIDDYEIKSTGPSIVLGDIPGVVAFLTCPEYPDTRDSVSKMARLLTGRGYIVLAAGCAAMDIGIGDKNIYRDFPGTFDMGSMINTGSCVSSSHAIGALIKVASIFLHRRLDRNYEEIADYILNRIGAVGVMWGGITPKSFSASAGANRLGIPVIFGPQGYKFRRTLEGSPEKGGVFDARSGRMVEAGLTPAGLCVVSKTWEEAVVQAARLCIRPNDTTWGRQTKLRNYIELSESLLGEIPFDIAGCVRVSDDLPEDRGEDLLRILTENKWQPTYIPDPTLLERLIHDEAKSS